MTVLWGPCQQRQLPGALPRFPGSFCRNEGESDTSSPCCKAVGAVAGTGLCAEPRHGHHTPRRHLHEALLQAQREAPSVTAGQAPFSVGLRLALFSRAREREAPLPLPALFLLVSEPLPTPPSAGHKGKHPWWLRKSLLPMLGKDIARGRDAA